MSVLQLQIWTQRFDEDCRKVMGIIGFLYPKRFGFVWFGPFCGTAWPINSWQLTSSDRSEDAQKRNPAMTKTYKNNQKQNFVEWLRRLSTVFFQTVKVSQLFDVSGVHIFVWRIEILWMGACLAAQGGCMVYTKPGSPHRCVDSNLSRTLNPMMNLKDGNPGTRGYQVSESLGLVEPAIAGCESCRPVRDWRPTKRVSRYPSKKPVATFFFPTCQVRVVRFYVSCPSSSSSSSSSSSPSPPRPPLCRHLRHHLRQLYVAMGSARPQQGAPECSGQRRTSTGSSRLQWAAPDLNRELQIAVGSAGPHPGGSRAEWAAPDLSCQKICQKICQKYVSQECQKICQKKCQKICQ